MSNKMKEYFKNIDDSIKKSYLFAEKIREKGYDPVDNVEILLTKDMAERVEGLISTVAPQIKDSKLVPRIKELEKEYGSQDWRIPLIISLETAQESFCKFKDKKEAIEVGLRVGLAYITNGVVSSPLEGFTRLEIKKRKDGKDYFALYFAGPIRSAGTTAVCIFVAVADYVRRNMGYDVYDPTEDEIKRMSTEVEDFHERITNLQYFPSKEETEFMVRHLPVQIEGEPTEKLEVSNYKNLQRVESDRIRNGVCLVMGEGLTQKASKFYGKFSKFMKEFKMDDWKFMGDFVTLQKKIRAKEKKVEGGGIEADFNFIKDLVAGRPILTHPLETGGFRLRYGRARNSGLSSTSISPVTMAVLKGYIASGTQLKVERPGKSTVTSVCDKLEGPIVKLKNGNVLFLDDEDHVDRVLNEIEEILFLGDILISYGDFLDRAHKLVPVGYNEEWYSLELEKLEKKNDLILELIRNPYKKISGIEAMELSKKFKVPLHPRYTYHWKDINKDQLGSLISWLKNGVLDNEKLILPFIYDLSVDVEDKDPKRILELLGVPHKVVANEHIILNEDDSYIINNLNLKEEVKEEDSLEAVNKLFGITIRDKSGTFIGARMGRPEKAKMRKMTGSPRGLFPVGEEGGKMRSLHSSLEKGKVYAEFPIFYCPKCSKETIYPRCEICDGKTDRKYYCYYCKAEKDGFCEEHNTHGSKRMDIDVKGYYDAALKKIGLRAYDSLIKGIRGTSNLESIPENLVKSILRTKHDIFVNKDGTTRYDMTEMAITHFKAKEINVDVDKLKELGYEKDRYGNDLKDDDQVVELKPQDIILPACDESLEDGADQVLFRVANFIDELSSKFYNEKKFYDLKKPEDLIGHLVVGLSPHTSAGNVLRIIGFSRTQGFYAHPLVHCMMRRDCDGDEACVILLMDALINFSRKFLPSHRGTTQDAPLVLNTMVIPGEVDDMIYNMDIANKYPLELYESALEYKYPWDVKISLYGDNLGKEDQFENLGFTHDTENINMGSRYSSYKSVPLMKDKVRGQMELAEKIRAVDEVDVARLVIERHFIRDIKGNLRKFSTQQFRCVDCNTKYRRPPLIGKCSKCSGRIIFTVAHGSIIKYLKPSLDLAEKYDLPTYLRQTLEITKNRIESIFGKDKEKQESIEKWF